MLNKTLIDFALYSSIGYAIGFGTSLLFKRKSAIRIFGVGMGCGYSFNKNRSAFNRIVN